MDVDTSNLVCDLNEYTGDKSTFFSKYYLRRPTSINIESANESEEINVQIVEPDISLSRLKVFPKIVFLGTNSSIASPYRNVASILVHTT